MKFWKMKDVKNFICCMALGYYNKEIKVENVAESWESWEMLLKCSLMVKAMLT